MIQSIKANFKQATVKSGVATLQFEVLTEAEGAFDIIKQSGTNVILTVASEQTDITDIHIFNKATGEVAGDLYE